MRRLISQAKDASIEEPIVNLTPLIDVVFVILIAFIVIAPLLNLDQIELANTGGKSSLSFAAQEMGPLAIQVKKDNSIYYSGKRVSIQELTPLLARAKVEHPKGRVQLFHDKNASFGTYQSIKNVVEAAGFDQLDIVLKSG